MKTSKIMPFLVLAIAAGMLGIDMFTDFVITQEMVQLSMIILAPLGLGGLVNKGFNVYKSIKEKQKS